MERGLTPYFVAADWGNVKLRRPPASIAVQRYKYLAPIDNLWNSGDSRRELPSWIKRPSRQSCLADIQNGIAQLGAALRLGIGAPPYLSPSSWVLTTDISAASIWSKVTCPSMVFSSLRAALRALRVFNALLANVPTKALISRFPSSPSAGR